MIQDSKTSCFFLSDCLLFHSFSSWDKVHPVHVEDSGQSRLHTSLPASPVSVMDGHASTVQTDVFQLCEVNHVNMDETNQVHSQQAIPRPTPYVLTPTCSQTSCTRPVNWLHDQSQSPTPPHWEHRPSVTHSSRLTIPHNKGWVYLDTHTVQFEGALDAQHSDTRLLIQTFQASY